jgi:hypothetical protein
MPQIEIDFDVFKELTNRRPVESITYNDVVRELLRLPKTGKTEKTQSPIGKPWQVSNTSFPEGSEFTADYKGKSYAAIVRDGKLVVNGRRFSTPSAAAISITGNSVNGWRFWRCKLPGALHFVPIERLRGKTN